MNNEALIKPTFQEQLLVKIKEKKLKNISGQEAEYLESKKRNFARYLERQKKYFVSSFYELILKYFVLKKEDLADMSEQEIRALLELVYERAHRASWYTRVFLGCIPFIGWVILANPAPSTI